MSVRPDGKAAHRARAVFGRLSMADDRGPLLILPAGLRQDIVAHMRQCLPHEGVGLIATSGRRTRMVADLFYPGRNIDPSPRRYTMDPADVLTALHDMERRRTWLGAIVHSHPDTPPVSSVTDLAEANLPGVLSLIVGFSPVLGLRAWSLVFDGRGIAVRGEEVAVALDRDARGGTARAWDADG